MNKQEALSRKAEIEAELKQLQTIIDEQPPIEYIKERLNGCEIRTVLEGLPNITMAFFKDRKWLVYWDKDFPDSVFFRYVFWEEIQTKFGTNYNQTKQLLNEWLDDALRIKRVTPDGFVLWHQSTLDEAFKLSHKDQNK